MSELGLEIAKHGGLVWLLIIATVALIFNSGVAWTQFRYMRTSMVTKKDMEITLLRFEKQLDEKYVAKEDCERYFGNRAGGATHAHD